ncbi:cytochrome c oxidase subunit 4 [Microbacterium sediminis]|uniref:cytochrome-c oxidase n=1 Tax=Microbacterium sediminis TaxID=904291 RepID=A0A1B9N974_9MICO|nr:cytochrome c oxidase subunit 4 [Microbacterium sediminis]OCG73140.1 cytochrome c oxidase subunit IV [Microbacterium sediminis]QBR74487.1 cytochrome c oxidase subunit 4 [Microbacterium sediminis]
MRSNVVIWWLLAAFFAVAFAVYAIWDLLDNPRGLPWYQAVDWTGGTALLFSVFMASMVAFYVQLVHRGQKGVDLPEDRLDADIDDADAEMGEFSPWSWWPILLAGAAALGALSLAVGIFLLPFAVGLLAVSLVGWVYEYYRGNFAR